MVNKKLVRSKIMSDAFSRNINEDEIPTRSGLIKEARAIRNRRNSQEEYIELSELEKREKDKKRIEFIHDVYPRIKIK